MTRQPNFRGVWVKLERAKEHINDLEARVQMFKQAEPYRDFRYCELGTGDLVFKVKASEQPPLWWSAILGDAIHNLRSSLDLLVCELVDAEGKTIKEKTGFPIAKDANAFESGYLRKVKGAPSTSGKELRWELEGHKKFAPDSLYTPSEEEDPELTKKIEKEFHHRAVAAPSEIKFRRNLDPGGVGGPWIDESDFELVPWAVIKEQFGAQLLLDPKSESGVSVVCTREPIDEWLEYLDNFASSAAAPTGAGVLASHLNSVLDDISPYVLVSEDGTLEGVWRCSNLLEAMHVMLFLDLTSGRTYNEVPEVGMPELLSDGLTGEQVLL